MEINQQVLNIFKKGQISFTLKKKNQHKLSSQV